MAPVPRHLLDLAECFNAHIPLARGDERIERPGWVVWLGGGTHPALNVAQRFRLGEDQVEAAVAEIRALFTGRGRPRSTWEIGPSATPADLERRLLGLGMVPFEEPVATGMVLTRAPPRQDHEIVVRRVKTVDDHVLAAEVLNAVFGERSETPAERRARAERQLAELEAGRGALFLGLLDGEPVAAATALYVGDAVVLGGGATLPRARGRGAYRALVAARYEDAVRRGTPTLVVQAGEMSRPILERLGFEPVAEVRVLLDGAPDPATG